MAKKTTEAKKTVTVEQIGSPIRRPAIQRQTLVGLESQQDAPSAHHGRYSCGSRHDPCGPASRSRR